MTQENPPPDIENPDEVTHPDVTSPDMLQEEPKNEMEEYKDKYLRLLAEMENTRKRLQKEKQETMRFSIENIISEFLTPIDNLENALKCTQGMSQETVNWVRGFEMIAGQFKEILAQHGITAFSSLGAAFDPYMHEAVEVEELDDCKDGTILQEFVKGYKSSARVLRPARVKVAKKKAPETKN